MDPLDVHCPAARQWLSALRDGEAGEHPELHAHVESCAECQRWDATADALTRRVRVHRAGSPDVSAAAVRAFPTEQRPRSLAGYARWALGVAGVAGLALAVFGLVTSQGVAVDSGLHLGHDVYSFETALALGFLLTAFRPDYGRGLLPVTATAALLMVLPSVTYVAAGHRDLIQEVSHVPMLIGLLGLLLLLMDGHRRLATTQRAPA